MARSSTRKQVVFIKAKKHSVLAMSKKRPALSPVDRAKASKDKMVGEPAKLFRPFVVPALSKQAQRSRWPQLLKIATTLLSISAFGGLFVFLIVKTSHTSQQRPASAAAIPWPASPSAGSRAPPTDESFVSTYGGLSNHDRPVSTNGSPAQLGNAAGSQQEGAGERQISSRALPMDKSLFSAYDGSRKPVYLPNISGNCVIKGAGVNAFGECLRQQLQGPVQRK